jgi:hypothetical protein
MSKESKSKVAREGRMCAVTADCACAMPTVVADSTRTCACMRHLGQRLQ